MLFQPKYGPTYTTPCFMTLSLVAVAFAGYAMFRRMILAENKHRKALLEGWTEAEVEAERLHGKGPVRYPDHGMIKVIHNLVGSDMRERLRAKASDGRRGDERITFQYGV